MRDPESWGRFPRTRHAAVVPVRWANGDALRSSAHLSRLAHGLGRSYGDACLNDGGVLLTTRTLDRFVALDAEAAVLTCEAGVSLAEVLDLVAPHGLFLPVVPGTKHVTVGGAIANDVHGKNHHRAGTFGRHVLEIELARSTGARIVCSPTQNPALFAATVGGLGLTGLVLRATLRLARVGDHLRARTVALGSLDDFFARSGASDSENEFTVAWVDALATGRRLGRGLLHQGNWGPPEGRPAPRSRAGARLRVPFQLPFSLLGRHTVRAFNAVVHARGRRAAGERRVRADAFFFPLDGVDRWNLVYGRAGLVQFQCAIPPAASAEAMRALLATVSASGEASFLGVLKNFGAVASPGLLSFPREGTTLALDFPNRGARTARLFHELHAIVRAHQGRLYPAKDALMDPAQFQAQYAAALPAFLAQRDPAFSSSLWRRVMPDA
ncbi:MAG TPA: FAD-binding oxidoreductase [Anaeromyxobacteraceae bacterium]|nr:FAD-binding oxidoreductase [Anaeromyxobacteraceae bacterium]